jgi:predicted AlkP superfamily phosphohydrolase/phosphomutase
MVRKPKVLVIGLDGASPLLVEKWMQSGSLPTLTKIMVNGGYTKLRSVMPVLSSAAWSSFMTGMNPGKHGIYDFARRDEHSYRLQVVHREHNRAPSLWRLLSDHNRRVAVMNVPLTYPPERVNGVLVSGLGTPNYKIFTHPAQLSQELLQWGYRINKDLVYKPGNEQKYLDHLYEIAQRQHDAALRLMSMEAWDLFTIVFFDTDQVAHYFWKYMDPTHPDHPPRTHGFEDAIEKFYRQMDNYVQDLVDAAGDHTNLFVVSDHGAGPYVQDVFLNEWLRQQGYLVTAPQEGKTIGLHRIFSAFGITRENVSMGLRKMRLGIVERWIKDLLGDRIEVLPRSQRPEFPHAIDWTKTRAYSFGYQGQIYINLQGREPQGTVLPGDEYDRLCQEITARLATFTDPRDGKPVVSRVYRREELFSGPYMDLAPDLVLVMRDLTYNTRMGYEFGSQAGALFSSPVRGESGSHRSEGILFACGPDILKRGQIPDGADLIDLAPTILHLLGCPIPSQMDGRLLESWLSTSHPPEYQEQISAEREIQGPDTVLTQEEENEILSRLNDLGYLN